MGQPTVFVEAGGEPFVAWAKSKLSQLTAVRESIRLPTMRKTYTPQDGVMINLRSSEFGDQIRITAAPGLGYTTYGNTVSGMPHVFEVLSGGRAKIVPPPIKLVLKGDPMNGLAKPTASSVFKNVFTGMNGYIFGANFYTPVDYTRSGADVITNINVDPSEFIRMTGATAEGYFIYASAEAASAIGGTLYGASKQPDGSWSPVTASIATMLSPYLTATGLSSWAADYTHTTYSLAGVPITLDISIQYGQNRLNVDYSYVTGAAGAAIDPSTAQYVLSYATKSLLFKVNYDATITLLKSITRVSSQDMIWNDGGGSPFISQVGVALDGSECAVLVGNTGAAFAPQMDPSDIQAGTTTVGDFTIETNVVKSGTLLPNFVTTFVSSGGQWDGTWKVKLDGTEVYSYIAMADTTVIPTINPRRNEILVSGKDYAVMMWVRELDRYESYHIVSNHVTSRLVDSADLTLSGAAAGYAVLSDFSTFLRWYSGVVGYTIVKDGTDLHTSTTGGLLSFGNMLVGTKELCFYVSDVTAPPTAFTKVSLSYDKDGVITVKETVQPVLQDSVVNGKTWTAQNPPTLTTINSYTPYDTVASIIIPT